jgi:ArsR family transcriptional regulator, arsenate/arsenite/antimonite-responsive transcriptional repressor
VLTTQPDRFDTPDMAEARLLRALADPTRLSIVRQLASEAATCQCDLTACCELAQPTVSHHLKVLRDAGLIQAERRGTWTYYSLDPRGLARLARLIGGLLPFDPTASDLGRRLPVLDVMPQAAQQG